MRRWNLYGLCLIGLPLAVGLAVGNHPSGAKQPDGTPPAAERTPGDGLALPGPEATGGLPPTLSKDTGAKPDAPPVPPTLATPETGPAPPAMIPVPNAAAPDANATEPSGSPRGKQARPPALVPVTDGGSPKSTGPANPPAFRLVDPPAPAEPGPVCPAAIAGVEQVAATEKTPAAPALAARTPALSLEKLSPAEAAVNRPLAYEIVVRNVGPVAIQQVRAEDRLPPEVRFLSAMPQAERQGDRLVWDLGKLDAGVEKRIQVEVVPERPVELLPAAVVTYAVAPAGRLHCQPAAPAAPAAPGAPAKPSPVTVKATGPATAVVGQTVVFQIEIVNTGDAPAQGLMIHDHLPAGLRHPQGTDIEADLGTLGPHATRKVTLPTTAVQAGRLTNEVTVTAPDGAQSRSETAVEVAEGRLRVNLAGPSRTWVGKEMQYRIDVVNACATNAENVRVQDVLPAGLELITAEDGGTYDPTTRAVNWQIAMLPAGQTRSATVKVRATSRGDLTNRVSARPQDGEEARAEAVVQVGGMPTLTLDIANPEHQVEIGRETTYEILATNRGTQTASGVQVIATLPEGMTPRSAAGPTEYRIQGQQVIFAPLARMEAGGDAHFRVTARCEAKGEMHFRAQLTANQARLPLCQEEVTLGCSDKK